MVGNIVPGDARAADHIDGVKIMIHPIVMVAVLTEIVLGHVTQMVRVVGLATLFLGVFRIQEGITMLTAV